MPSTVISKMQYDPLNKTLRIAFVSGLVYEYKNVPPDVYRAFRTSGAKGVFLNQQIKPFYPYEKVNNN